MDESFLKEHVARCRSLAGISNDPFIKKRLLALASRYEDNMNGRPRPPMSLARLPINTITQDDVELGLKAKPK